ncbi:MAG: acyltransferase, partial [Microbacteriaceae bacterium]|nr:acyltransferase [Microbacteriaceae bacterium]
SRAILWTVVIVAVVSYGLSILLTQLTGPPAYFTTHTRMWEFAVGGLVALLPALRPSSRWMNALLGWAGVLLVLGSGWFLDRQTPFPGWVALLPVAGTALAIAAARSDAWWLPGRVLAVAPARFLGDVSYSLYLWHWPLIIVAPYIPGWPLEWWNRVLLLVAAILLAWLTKRLVEDPARGWRRLAAARPRRTAVASIAAMAVVAASIGGVWAVQAPRYDAEATTLAAVQADPPACFGAGAFLEDCDPAELPDGMVPGVGFAEADTPSHPECLSQLNDPTLRPCTFGSNAPDAPRVALIGDSHAYQYLDTMIALAEAEGWSLTTYLKGACPWSAAPLAEGGAFGEGCALFQQRLADELVSGEGFDAIVTAALTTTAYSMPDVDELPSIPTDDPAALGYSMAWGSASAPVIALRDNPHFPDNPVKCLAQTGSADDCAIAIEDAVLADDPFLEAAALTPAATLIDLTDWYCAEGWCPPVIAGATVYRDKDHLTATWVSTLAPVLREHIETALQR